MVELPLMPGSLSNDSSTCEERKRRTPFAFLLLNVTRFHRSSVCVFFIAGNTHRGIVGILIYQWCQNNSVPCQCHASAPGPPLLGGREEPYARLRILAFFGRICQRSQAVGSDVQPRTWPGPH